MKVKVGDKVKILAGKDRGKDRGKTKGKGKGKGRGKERKQLLY